MKTNPKTKKASKSKPIGYKNAKIPKLKGGKGEIQKSKVRGGMGASRPNFGKAIRRSAIPGVGGGRF